MRWRAWAAMNGVMAGMVLMAGTVSTVSQAQSQPQPGMDQLGGMMPAHEMSTPAVPAGPLKIVFGDKSAEWTPATLAALPHQTVTVINGHTKASLTYSGVPLIELLKQLGVLGEETMAAALEGVGPENIAQMVSQLSVVKENLRRLIQHRNDHPAGERHYG